MTERQHVSKLMPRLRAVPNSWWYKIADIPGKTGKRPFDIIGVVNGHALAIECKKGKGTLSEHQITELSKFALAGGVSRLFNFTEHNVDDLIADIIDATKAPQPRQ